jgi:formamidopyrimidine-DNA glycosylase
VPELPEVETLRRGLERSIQGRQIAEVVVANAKVLKGQSEAVFRERLCGATIGEIRRRGKYILVDLASQSTNAPTTQDTPSHVLCIHLKMRGQLILEPSRTPPGPYHCVSLKLEHRESQEEEQSLRFYDMWTWGEMRALTPAELQAVSGLTEMGPEPLDAGWNGDVLRAKLGTRRGPIKPALLDQKVVAGVGNIYADESLFRCGIRPERAVNGLTVDETDRLSQAIRKVLTDAVGGGGTMSDEYVDLSGVAGRYVPQVYDRGGHPCENCGTTLTKIRLGGRGTVYCPACQS